MIYKCLLEVAQNRAIFCQFPPIPLLMKRLLSLSQIGKCYNDCKKEVRLCRLNGYVPYLDKGPVGFLLPPTQESRNDKNWIAVLDLKTCLECRAHGQIYLMDETPDIEPPLHPNCRCDIKPMKEVEAGYGTKDGQNGSNYWMKYVASLPKYYITRNELKRLGWRRGKSPAKFAPGKMATMGIY